MERKRQIPRTIRPYLTTSEVTEIAGVTPRVLRNLIAKGILAPLNSEDDEYYDRWSFGQTVDLQMIQSMRPSNAPLADIMDAVGQGGNALIDSTYFWAVDSMRQQRRALKAIVHRKRQTQRFAPVGIRSGYYLRYLPQRWMALIPATTGETNLVNTDLYMQRFIDLKRMIEIVGWSPTFSAGTLVSLSPNYSDTTNYVFFELASPSMPYATGSMIVDGGCYRVIDGESSPQCEGVNCLECSRFGRNPTDKERFLWKHLEATGQLLDRTAMADTTPPYATGIWNACFPGTKEGRKSDPPSPKGPGAGRLNPAVRPRLMPHETRLPLGVTACVLPAGIYLCCQNNYEERENVLQRMLGALSIMPSRDFTEADELRMAKVAAEAEYTWGHASHSRPGPFVEPFAAPRDHGNPEMFGFVQDIAHHDLTKLVLPSNMGLAPEDGRVVVHTDLPLNTSDGGNRQELQILVDPQGMVPAVHSKK